MADSARDDRVRGAAQTIKHYRFPFTCSRPGAFTKGPRQMS